MRPPPPRDALHTTEQAALALSVPAARIRRWSHDGKVVPQGRLPAGVPGGWLPLYKLEELEPFARAYHARRTTTRRTEA